MKKQCIFFSFSLNYKRDGCKNLNTKKHARLQSCLRVQSHSSYFLVFFFSVFLFDLCFAWLEIIWKWKKKIVYTHEIIKKEKKRKIQYSIFKKCFINNEAYKK